MSIRKYLLDDMSTQEEAKKKGYTSAGGPYWKDKTNKIVAKTQNNKLVDVDKTDNINGIETLDKMDAEQASGSNMEADQEPGSNMPQQAPPNPLLQIQGEKQTTAVFLGIGAPPKISDKDAYKAFNVCHSLVKSNTKSNAQIEDMETQEKANEITSTFISDMYGVTKEEERDQKQYLEKLITDYNITQDEKGKIKFIHLGYETNNSELSDIFKGDTKKLKDYFDHFGKGLVKIPKSTGNHINDLTKAAKPESGLSIISSTSFINAANDILNSKDLGKLDKKFHNLYGMTDDNGFVLNTTDNNGRYLQESIKQNKSIDKTINKLEEMELLGKISKGSKDILISHKERMISIAADAADTNKEHMWAKDKYGQTELAKRIQKSYAETINSLYEKDEKAALAVMKQFAETCAYETETANKEEVYLPVSGNFPIGDKLKVTRKSRVDDGKITIEKVESISVKAGKNGLGFGSNINMFTRLLPNKKDQDIVGSLKDGHHDIGIDNELLDGSDERWDNIFGDYIEKDKNKEIKNVLIKYREEFNKVDKGDKEKINTLNQKYMKKIPMNKKEIGSLVGSKNEKVCSEDPRALITTLAFKYSIGKSNGYDKIEFNHAFIAGGAMATVLERPDQDMDNWILKYRFDDDKGIPNATYEGKKLKSVRSGLRKIGKQLEKEGIKGKEYNRQIQQELQNLCIKYDVPPPKIDESKFKTFLFSDIIVESKEEDD